MADGASGESVLATPRGRRGFTLIEVMLVVVIVGIATGLALPSFLRAYQNAQIQTASRNVVMATRFARNMAVLRQQPMAILFDQVKGQVEVVRMAGTRQREAAEMFLESREREPVPVAEGEAGEAAPAPALAIEAEFRRTFGREVRIVGFESEQPEQELEGIHWVTFHPNGMNDGFVLRLEDKRGNVCEVTVDAISGRSKVEFP
jgi:general secretion pathway protein H